MQRPRTLPILVILALVACGEGSVGDPSNPSYDFEPLEVPDDFPGEYAPSAECVSYFRFDPYRDSDCQLSFAALGLRRELVLYTGPGDFWAPEFTRGLARFADLYGLQFTTHWLPFPVELRWVLDDDEQALRDHLVQAFPDVDFEAAEFTGTNEQYAAIMAETTRFVLRPMVDFARVYGHLGPGVTNVVLLPAITRFEAEGQGQGLDPNKTVIGMGLSATLLEVLAAQGDEVAEMWSYFDLGDFTPMLFLNAGRLTTIVHVEGNDPVLLDLVMNHELGHTLGLVHRDQPRNLMNPGFESRWDIACETTLDPDQLQTIRDTLTGSGAGAGSGGGSTVLSRPAPGSRAAWRLLTDHLAGRRPLPLFR